MENASKALIIAGAILISILIIGLGVFIYGQASSTVKKANLNSQEAQAQNQQFETYFGDKKSSTEVKALMSLIRTNNITSSTNGETKTIYVLYGATASSATTPAVVSTSVSAGKTYNVSVENDNSSDDQTASTIKTGAAAYYTSGYIKIIKVVQN